MKKSIALFAVAILAVGLSAAALAQEHTTTVTRAPATDKPAGIIVDEVHVTAEVKAIDYEKRSVDLALPSGETRTLTVSQDAVNFPQVKVGDTVDVSYVESLAIALLGPAEAPVTGEGTVVALAPVGAKPGGLAVNTQRITARVTAIDQAARMITLTGPQGNTRTVKAGPEVKRFNEIRVGDQITVQYTEALLLDVKTAKPAPKPGAPKQ
jgi:hypothetical protein